MAFINKRAKTNAKSDITSKVPEMKVSPQAAKRINIHQSPPRFTWHTSKKESAPVFQPKNTNQPLRFFGSNSHLWFSDRKDNKEELVKWENTFNMRAHNLNQINSNTNYRSTYRSQAVVLQRARLGFISGTAKSLDILRQNLQKNINKEIDDVLQKYLKKFFKLAIENIKQNNGEQAVSDQHIQTLCRQILEEAKEMYQVSTNSNVNLSSVTIEGESNLSECTKPSRPNTKGLLKKHKESDSDSEVCLPLPKPKKKKGRPPIHHSTVSSGRSTPMKIKIDQIKREGPKWDPDRLTSKTLFIMGAKANKALGLGATRGRLYIKHPEVFKYSGDQEDKQWLYDHNLMPATGGKAYMLLVEDIQELAESEEYRNNPSLMVNEIVGFTIPESMLLKMKASMQQMRSDAPVRKRGRPAGGENGAKEETNSADKSSISQTVSPSGEVDLLGNDLPSDRSLFCLSTGFGNISPAHADISPSPSDMSTTLEPPETASFDVTSPP